jgi:hypothetical protein
MKTVKAYFSHEVIVPYYLTLPDHQLICIVDGDWWQEPGFPIGEGYDIRIVDKPKEGVRNE